ncbi:MAG: hypothetical protein ACLPNY_07175, partial [Roseiarcus sp.]
KYRRSRNRPILSSEASQPSRLGDTQRTTILGQPPALGGSPIVTMPTDGKTNDRFPPIALKNSINDRLGVSPLMALVAVGGVFRRSRPKAAIPRVRQ